ncbi:MAG: RNA 3'-terminal phosphate cyclase [Candidatus Aenigmarchaeota archaeon]|nr:RNA 3'-terminal phosphate cyclase [Candidatus Aenigmarchaeota archaeon]
MSSKFIEIDGSVMEGGGSILRLSSALSVLTKKPVRIFNIRSGRPQPGLRTQHLRGLEATAEMSGGRVEGARIGATEVFFYPGTEHSEHISIGIETAGSVGLVIQSLLISSIGIKKKLVVDIEGGATFGKYAPPLQYIQFVLLPLLRRMGYHAEINIIRHGFYPVGGSKVKMIVQPPKKLKPVVMKERGDIESIDIISVAAMRLKKPRVAERQYREAESMLKKSGYSIEVKSGYSETPCPGSGMVLIAKSANGCIIGSDGLGEAGKKAEEVASDAVNALLGVIRAGSCVDEYMSDQLLPYMAMAEGRSAITAPVLSSHAQTNMHILEKFLPVKFTVSRTDCGVLIESERWLS